MNKRAFKSVSCPTVDELRGILARRFDLRSFQADIEGHACADQDGTLGTFRAKAAVHFDEFLLQKPRVVVAVVGHGWDNSFGSLCHRCRDW